MNKTLTLFSFHEVIQLRVRDEVFLPTLTMNRGEKNTGFEVELFPHECFQEPDLNEKEEE